MYNSRQSAAKLLKEYISKGEGSTTISRKESTVLEELETAGIEFYRLSLHKTLRKHIDAQTPLEGFLYKFN